MPLDASQLKGNPVIHRDQEASAREILFLANSVYSMFEQQLANLNEFYFVWNSYEGHEAKLLHICFISRFFQHIKKALPSDEKTLFITSLFFIVDAFGRNGEKDRMYKILKNHAANQQKETIIKSFKFSHTLPIRKLTEDEKKKYDQMRECYHVSCESKRGTPYRCSTQCVINRKEINELLRKVVEHLDGIRNSVVHRGTLSLYINDNYPPNFGSSLVDAYYPKSINKILDYEVSRYNRDQFTNIILQCLWKELVHKAKVRERVTK